MEINKENNIICCPCYLIDFDKSKEQILDQLRELCCDEYYEYLELINIEIIKKISKNIGCNIIISLILSCANNGSIKAFEFLIKKFNIVVKNNFLFDFESIKNIYFSKRNLTNYDLILNNDDKSKYWRCKFKKYILDNYNLDEEQLIIIVKDMYWDNQFELIKEIYYKLNTSPDNIKLLFDKLKTQLYNSCHYNQYETVKFLIGVYYNCIDNYIIDCIMLNIFKYSFTYILLNNFKYLRSWFV